MHCRETDNIPAMVRDIRKEDQYRALTEKAADPGCFGERRTESQAVEYKACIATGQVFKTAVDWC